MRSIYFDVATEALSVATTPEALGGELTGIGVNASIHEGLRCANLDVVL